MIVFNHPGSAQLVAVRAGWRVGPDDASVARLSDRDGSLLGGVIYTAYTRRTCQMHCAAGDPNWLTRDMLWAIFHYPFVQLRCERVFGPVPAMNLHALAFDLHVGFREAFRVPDVYPGENGDGDLIMLEMKREDCRWLRHKPKSIYWRGN